MAAKMLEKKTLKKLNIGDSTRGNWIDFINRELFIGAFDCAEVFAAQLGLDQVYFRI